MLQKGLKQSYEWFKMILKCLSFVFQTVQKVEKVAKIDQNGKGLVFSFCSIFAIFSTF